MVATADTVEWIAVRNEVEALFLEFNLIKKHRPRFNIRLQGRQVVPVPRGHPRRGVAAGDGDAGREAQGRPLLRARTPTPTRSARRSTCCCARSRSARAPRASSTATSGSAGRASTRTSRSASAPCVGAVEPRGVRRRSSTSCIEFLDGDTAPVLDRLDKQMHEASDELEFERAARLRDQIISVRKAIERQQMVDAKEEDYDADRDRRRPARGVGAGLLRAQGPGRRPQGPGGRQGRGRRAPGAGRSAARAALRRRRPAPTSRARSSSRTSPTTSSSTRSSSRSQRGSKVRVRVPQRGAKRELLETVTQNAEEAFAAAQAASARPTTTHGRGRCSRCRTRSTSPRRRCASSASTSRTCRAPRSSASMVVMEDGLPKRSDYRRFKIRHQPGQDDFASMEEVADPPLPPLPRRSATRAPAAASGSRTRRTSLLIDGGKGQLGVAVRVLEELGLEDICVASLAKRFEEVYLPGRAGAGAHPARLRGAVPAPAGARRGAPLRDHVPPPAARQEDDDARCSTTCPGLGPDAARRGCSRSSAR